MIITCGECNSSFVLDDSLIKVSGSKVRCSNCKYIFVVYPSKKEEPESAPEKPIAPQAEVAAPKVEQAAQTHVQIEEDPDLSKALADINEDELDFSDDELGLDKAQAPVEESVSPPQPVAAPPEPEPVAEEPAPEPEAEPEAPSEDVEAPQDDEDILDFADFELDMDEDDIPDDIAEPESSVTQELGLSFDEKDVLDDLDAGEDDDLGLDDELDFSDLERELSGEADTGSDITEGALSETDEDSADTVVVEDAELDFSDLSLDEDTGEKAVEDLDLSLDEDSALESETMMIEDELDFSDLERELEDSAADDGPASEDELDLDLDLDDEVESEPETVLLEDDDLDFSEFELDEDPAEKSEDVKEETVEALSEDESLDEELDFSGLSDILESDEVDEAPDLGDDEDLELELDLDSDDGMDESPAKSDDDEEELDFSDLENILDGIDEIDETKVEALPEDINLELDEDLGGEEDFDLSMDDSGPKTEAAEEDLDFSDVEAMLGSGDEDDEDLDLDLDLGDREDDDIGSDDEELSLSLDNEEDSDIELELDLSEEDDAFEEGEDDEFEDDEEDLMAALPDAPGGDMEAMADEKKKPKKAAKKKPAKRKAKGKGGLVVKLIVFLVLLLVILLGLYLSKNKIEDMTGVVIPVSIPVLEDLRDSLGGMGIPFVSTWVKPEPKDPQGKLMLKTTGITGKIIVSESLGDLFVISGKVQNNYSSTRNSISLVGKLFGEGGKVVQSKLFYAGNVIPEDELVTMDEDIIKKRLQNRLGDNGINAKVRPGQIVPFMVVFTNLTENLTEFSVETGGSFQGAAIK